ncbi:MAG: hypothetical protein Q8880_06285 [Bacteroidota bacterium]|nr:hypothetical protein [Bacteroidota bacterium]
MDEIIVQFQKGLITKEEFGKRQVIIFDSQTEIPIKQRIPAEV